MRQILFAFWKTHILYHASERPIYGQWIITELRRHGYEISPGTVYPLLERLEQCGWLQRRRQSEASDGIGARRRKQYELGQQGLAALERLREGVTQLYEEVVLESGSSDSRRRRGARRQKGGS